jgi:Response regulator containing CheY-like receiver, AAA-type ATPase, and DNA-binding domains
MNPTNELLHRIADSSLTQSERAQLRCQLAKQLEEAGKYDAAREAMGELWQGVSHHPVLDDLDQKTAAEVLLRAGVLTGWIGSSKQIEGAQETAKNLISESLTLFDMLGDTEQFAEAQTELAVCYWREGAYNEARDMMKEALSHLANDADPVRAIILSRLATVERTAKRYNDAFRFLTQAMPLIEKSNNHTLKGKFYNQLALVLRNLGTAEHREDYIDRALIEYAAASYHFEQAGHTRYQACVENNLGFLFGTIKKFTEAHEHLDRAQALFTRLRDKVHLAQVDDARARILIEEGKIAEAEKLSRSAVQILETGGQQSLLAEALTTHGIALARLDNHERARQALLKAIDVAQISDDYESAGQAALTLIEELGESLTDGQLSLSYEHALDLLATSTHPSTKDRLLSCARRVLFLVGAIRSATIWKGFSLERAVRRYESRIIERALKDAGGSVTRAARLLGLKHHGTLINKLNKWHRHLLSNRSPAVPRKFSLMFINEGEAESRPVTILHVEDNKMVADAVKETLELEGWTIDTLMDGTAALEVLQSETHYDVLIFDNDLPGIGGLELISQARQLVNHQHTPIIVLSASSIETEVQRAGANAFLRKPEDITAVTETIARLLARRKRG